MSGQIAERIRDLAVRCLRLAEESVDPQTAGQLDGLAADLAQEAKKLDLMSQYLKVEF